MTIIHTLLTAQKHTETAKEYAIKKCGYTEEDHSSLANFSLGWNESAFASVLNAIADKYGDDALLEILDKVYIPPVYKSAV
jgi:hypothetical protein